MGVAVAPPLGPVGPVGPADPPPVNNVLLIYKPLLSTRIRSHVPAPINTVHTQAAAATNEPIIVLLIPVVNEHPALAPIAILLPVALLLYKAQ